MMKVGEGKEGGGGRKQEGKIGRWKDERGEEMGTVTQEGKEWKRWFKNTMRGGRKGKERELEAGREDGTVEV
jgi:hypothetical protein